MTPPRVPAPSPAAHQAAPPLNKQEVVVSSAGTARQVGADHVPVVAPAASSLGWRTRLARFVSRYVPPPLVLGAQQTLSYAGVGALASGGKLMIEGNPPPFFIDMHYIERMPHVALVGLCFGFIMNGIRLPEELLNKVPAEYRHHFAGALTQAERELPAAQQMAILSYRAGLIGEFIFTKMRWKEEILTFINNPKHREALNLLGLQRSGQAITLGGELLVTSLYVPVLFKLGIGLDMSWSTAAMAGFDIGLFGSYIATLINLSATPAKQPEANIVRQINFGILNSLATTMALFPREYGLPLLILASGLLYAHVFNNREELQRRLGAD